MTRIEAYEAIRSFKQAHKLSKLTPEQDRQYMQLLNAYEIACTGRPLFKL